MTAVWLSPHARQRHEAELVELMSRHDVSGDTDDDGGVVEAWLARRTRIGEIHELLSNAADGTFPPDDGVAEPGMVLTVRYADSGDTETFLLGVRGAEGSDIEVYSPNSPLGRALLGATPGDHRDYLLPNGREQRVTLVAAVSLGAHLTAPTPAGQT
ncbi:MAG: transcription elongation factor GreA [Actinomycetota bacterium]|nr:transcription elongation factor GreA [Actinomycetota bacterium]